jgi:hypothetical protein
MAAELIAVVTQIYQSARTNWSAQRVLCLLVALLVGSAGLVSHADDGPDRNEEWAKIVAAHKNRRDSIISIRLVVEVIYDTTTKLYVDAGLEGVDFREYQDFIWCKDGRYRRHSYVREDDGPEKSRRLVCGDGKYFYSADYDPLGSTFERPATVSYVGNPLGSHALSWPQEAPTLRNMGISRFQSLSDLLEGGQLTLEGFEERDGQQFPLLTDPTASGSGSILVLDPSRGYLPIEERPRPNGGHFRVTAFRKTDQGLWVPSTGEFSSHATRATCELKSVEVNSELPPSLFEPPIARETQFADHAGRLADNQGDMSLEHLRRWSAEGTRSSDSSADAVKFPTDELRFWTLCLIPVVTLVFLGITVFHRRREAPSDHQSDSGEIT